MGLAEHWSLTLRLLRSTLDPRGQWSFWDGYENYSSNESKLVRQWAGFSTAPVLFFSFLTFLYLLPLPP